MENIQKVLLFISVILVLVDTRCPEKPTETTCGYSNQQFQDYILKYNIQVPDEATMARYQQQFYQTKKEIDAFNAQSGNTFTQSINRFAHMSMSEVVQTCLGLTVMRYTLSNIHAQQPKQFGPKCTPRPIDWSKVEGAVSPVKDQGNCGNSFVFSTVAAIESFAFIKTNKSYVLSDQYAMDCCSKLWKINGDGCRGGQPEFIYDVAIAMHGLPTEKSYPYQATDSRICPQVETVQDTNIRSYKTLGSKDEDEIACMLADGPMTVAIYVNASLLRYSGGIYNDVVSCTSDKLVNHAVLLVGYDLDPDTGAEFFIFKNSWGLGFGEDGYFRLQKGLNLCGITRLVQQPSLDEDYYEY